MKELIIRAWTVMVIAIWTVSGFVFCNSTCPAEIFFGTVISTIIISGATCILYDMRN